MKTVTLSIQLDELKELDEIASNYQLKLLLVGGAVRDLISTSKLPHDLDFEVRPNDQLEEVEFSVKYRQFCKHFKDLNYKVESLPFSITRIIYGDYDCEFSPPRVEVFNETSGHKNFQAIIDPELSFRDAVKRRDFTINSIGIDLSTNKIIDPLDGCGDLKREVLKPSSEQFHRDPVRFLRAIRFKTKMGLSLHPSLEREMMKMDLREVTEYYLRSEAVKSKNVATFFSRLGHFITKFNISLPIDWEPIFRLKNSSNLKAETVEEHLFLSLLESKRDDVELAFEFFNVKKSLKDLVIRLHQKLHDFSIAIQDIDSLPSMESTIYSDLFELHSLIQKLSSKMSSEIIKDVVYSNLDAPSWLKEALLHKLVGGEKFKQILEEKSVPNELRNGYRFYAHLSEVLFGA